MARTLQPCGTYAAYRRHLRNGETVCDLCAQAARDQNNTRAGLPPRAMQVTDIPPEPLAEVPDPREDALENLAAVMDAMKRAAPRELPALSKRRQELVEYLHSMNHHEESSLADKLAAARAQREQRNRESDP